MFSKFEFLSDTAFLWTCGVWYSIPMKIQSQETYLNKIVPICIYNNLLNKFDTSLGLDFANIVRTTWINNQYLYFTLATKHAKLEAAQTGQEQPSPNPKLARRTISPIELRSNQQLRNPTHLSAAGHALVKQHNSKCKFNAAITQHTQHTTCSATIHTQSGTKHKKTNKLH